MLDIKFIRENKELIAEGAKKKHLKFDVEALIKADDERKALTLLVEEKRAKQNEASKRLPYMKDALEKKNLLEDMKLLKDELQKEEEKIQENKSLISHPHSSHNRGMAGRCQPGKYGKRG